jgi:hypothetical protein
MEDMTPLVLPSRRAGRAGARPVAWTPRAVSGPGNIGDFRLNPGTRVS